MPGSLELIRTLFEYHQSFYRRLWDECIMALTDEQFITEIPYSHGSIRNHMLHLANVDRGWVRGLQEYANARSDRYTVADYSTRESARAIWEKCAEEVMTYVHSLTEADLDHTPHDMPMTVGYTLLHLVNHGTDHRAQILRALHDFGAPTFEQDLVYYMLRD